MMNQAFSIKIDKQIYNDAVITKAIYWHTANFAVDRTFDGNSEIITFLAKENCIAEIDHKAVLAKFNQDLNDYKLRQIIAEETANVRTILYIKAFANNDDFEEYE